MGDEVAWDDDDEDVHVDVDVDANEHEERSTCVGGGERGGKVGDGDSEAGDKLG